MEIQRGFDLRTEDPIHPSPFRFRERPQPLEVGSGGIKKCFKCLNPLPGGQLASDNFKPDIEDVYKSRQRRDNIEPNLGTQKCGGLALQKRLHIGAINGVGGVAHTHWAATGQVERGTFRGVQPFSIEKSKNAINVNILWFLELEVSKTNYYCIRKKIYFLFYLIIGHFIVSFHN